MMRPSVDLRSYQQRIIAHLYEHDAALVAARPGAGKTIAALTAIHELLYGQVIRHALVIAPKRVARIVWPDEIKTWDHTGRLRYAVLAGSPVERLKLLATASERDITLVGIDVIPWLVEQLNMLPDEHSLFDLLVVDEISRLRDPKGTRSKALAKASNRWRNIWGMSGTLRPNSALDLFMPVRIVTRGKLWGRSFYKWRKKHFYAADYMGYDWRVLPGEEEKINLDIAPLTELVSEGEMPKVEPTIVLDRIELPPAARIEYERMQEKLLALYDDDEVIADSTAIATGKLAQIANGFVYDENTTHIVHDEKREWLRDLVETTTEPTLLIYEYRDDFRAIQDIAGVDIPYLGAGVSDKQAAKNIDDWNAGKLPFMAVSIKSAAHGLNLQHGGANMAWLAPNWSPELHEQMIARLARPGQKRPVVVRICVATDTVDELKLDRVHRKMSAQEAFEAWLRWNRCP
jgi:SNF2 family DNA or RNA helicase